MRAGALRRHSKPLAGIAYLVLIAVLLTLSIKTYTKSLPWQGAAEVTITTSAPGLELNPQSDVKFQGLRVGEVRRITSDGRTATIELAIEEERLALIPANIDAAIVPKTLFGEKFVDLRLPPRPAAARLASGGTIEQSTTSVEIGSLFRTLVPVLDALKPEQLSVVLNSLARAVDGRGATLARTFNQLDAFLGELDPNLDAFTDNLADFGEVAEIYAAGAPDLLRLLAASAGISRDLLVPKETDFAAFLAQVIATGEDTEQVLTENADNLIRLSGRARPVLALLDEYSSALPCFLKGLKTADILGNRAIGGHGPYTNLVIDVAAQNKPYTYPADSPDNPASDGNNANLPFNVPDFGPHCPEFSAEVLGLKQVKPYYAASQGNAIDPPGTPRAGTRPTSASVTEARLALARVLAAQSLGIPADEVPGYVDLLITPMLADGQVDVP